MTTIHLNNLPALNLHTLALCLNLLEARIAAAVGVLRIYKERPQVIGLALAHRYSRDYFRATTQLLELRAEIDRRFQEHFA